MSRYYNFRMLSAIDIARASSAPMRIPQKCPNATRASISVGASPAHSYVVNIYAVETAVSVNDPTIVNTPPSEFIDNLKERMNAYFSTPDR